MVPRIAFLALILVATGPGLAQEGKKKAPAMTDNEATVSFTNGSLVRMAVQQENFEVETEFGKLIVPAPQVRRIDFGVHLPEGTEEKIQTALKKLGSPAFKERDTGLNELVALGAYAYPSLIAAAKEKSGGPEVLQRIATAIQRIRAKVPENLLKTRKDDIIVTAKFTIVGRIVTPKIKAKAEHFGDLQLAVYGLRSIHWSVAGGDTEITVDATKYASIGQQQWLDTGFTADGLGKLTITASGMIDQWPQGPGQYTCGPKGLGNGMNDPRFGGGRIVIGPGGGPMGGGNFTPGALLGRIGDAGTTFVVGDNYQVTPEKEGKLYLRIAPSPWGCDSAGSFKVKISSGFPD